MTDPIDDVVNALNFQVKEETVKRYMHERLILEEELNEYREERNSVTKLAQEITVLHDQLGCLLVGSGNLWHFWELLGFPIPPLPTREETENYGAPACPISMTPRGFFKKSQYIDLVHQIYEAMAEKIKDCHGKVKYINELAKVINKDIDKFHLNFDLLSIITFLKSLDAAFELKKKILGSNFSAAEMSALERNMAFRKLKYKEPPPPSCPVLPSLDDARGLTADFLGEIFKKEKNEVLPALNKSRIYIPDQREEEDDNDAES